MSNDPNTPPTSTTPPAPTTSPPAPTPPAAPAIDPAKLQALGEAYQAACLAAANASSDADVQAKSLIQMQKDFNAALQMVNNEWRPKITAQHGIETAAITLKNTTSAAVVAARTALETFLIGNGNGPAA